MPPLAPRDCWFLTGPTASGKSAVGLALARELNAEILSLDSMALYRGLNIGTAKPSAEERAAVPHHLLDVLEPEHDFSVAEYVAAATAAVADISDRGRQPLFVGGTPLYLKALLRGLFEGPPADWDFRRRWQASAREHGPAWLHTQVARIDPAAAEKLPPQDMRRLIRALEVYEQTGRPISELQCEFDRARPAAECRVFVLSWPRESLVQRIDARVDRMFAEGLVGEVSQLLAGGHSLGRTASQALGYRETLAHLSGAHDLATTVGLVKTHTRQFAKRQLTWFRGLSECRWVPLHGDLDAPATARQIIAIPPPAADAATG